MNEKVKNAYEKVDRTMEKCNSILSEDFDRWLGILKTRGGAIPGIVERIASRFSVSAMLVCGLLYVVLCLKNMVVSFFFKGAPAGMCFAQAVGALVALALCVYAAAKMLDALSKVINSSECKISSLNIFSVFTAIGLLLTVASFLGGIYLAFEAKAVSLFFYGLAGAAFFALITIYSANPETFGITEDETASAGEDFVAIYTFGLKVMLRLVPVALLIVPIVGICQIVPMIFRTYVHQGENANRLMTGFMIAEMNFAMVFVFVGLIPLAAYLVYIFYYVVLDLIRAVLQLPNKLDALKK